MVASTDPADIHAEHVGSLLRPPWLLTARAEYQAGEIGEGELRAAEDRATDENIAIQRSAGLRVFTDGEVRRTNWMTGILESTGGMSPIDTPAVTWRREDGEVPPEDETDFVMTVATSKVFRKDHLTAVEAAYLAAQVPGQFKVTMMSAAMGGMTWRPEVSAAAYPDPADLVRDLVALQIEEIAELATLGTRWVQLDSLSYNQVFDDEFRAATGNPLDPAFILAGGGDRAAGLGLATGAGPLSGARWLSRVATMARWLRKAVFRRARQAYRRVRAARPLIEVDPRMHSKACLTNCGNRSLRAMCLTRSSRPRPSWPRRT